MQLTVWKYSLLILLMAGFDLRSFGMRSDHSANCATTAAHSPSSTLIFVNIAFYTKLNIRLVGFYVEGILIKCRVWQFVKCPLRSLLDILIPEITLHRAKDHYMAGLQFH